MAVKNQPTPQSPTEEAEVKLAALIVKKDEATKDRAGLKSEVIGHLKQLQKSLKQHDNVLQRHHLQFSLAQAILGELDANWDSLEAIKGQIKIGENVLKS